MKTLRRVLLLCVLNVIVLQNLLALEYFISFSGTGQSSTVESVIARNISKGTQVAVPTGYQLRLFDVWTGVKPLSFETENVKLFPNPIVDRATLSVFASKSNAGTIKIYTIDGRLMEAERVIYHEGINSFEISLPTGVYIITGEGKDFKSEVKAISFSLNHTEPTIKLSDQNDAIAIQKTKANNIVNLQYTSGDQMLFKGISGNFSTIVTDIPTESKTVNFDFVECRDEDGNNYTVVKIGNQVWMAENLKTTKYLNGDNIATTIPSNLNIGSETDPKYQWAYNGAENNVAKFGRLYTWHVIADSRGVAPVGWHLSTNDEWNTLKNYLASIGSDNAKSLSADSDWKYHASIGTIGHELSGNNFSGFTALPAGFRDVSGAYEEMTESELWWTTFNVNNTNARSQYLNFASGNSLGLAALDLPKAYGFSVRCVKNLLPTVSTATITSIEATSALGGGEVLTDGGSTVIQRGVCWNTNHNPTIADSKTIDGTGIGAFTSNIVGLSPGQTYYVRAYATNAEGTAYGEEKSFSTTADDGKVRDIDGNIYTTVTIGSQVWMVENLRTTKYRNGDPIPQVSDNSAWSVLSTGAWCDYENNASNGTIYGHLYNHYAVRDTRNIAPVGWHVATKLEWETLQAYLINNGYNFDGTKTDNKTGKAYASTTLWTTFTTVGTVGYNLPTNNTSGLNVLPSGYRDANNGTFATINTRAYLWLSDSSDALSGWCFYLRNTLSGCYNTTGNARGGFAVRCVKD
ncbi:MAG: hypothetical protein BWY27_00114 [Bacteroidetes bacterium ADurb.Bin234]|nr:MAG: hypothetical protein BWY27_00114 [Bacteroidetes bacterium ADurb.Bin234]